MFHKTKKNIYVIIMILLIVSIFLFYQGISKKRIQLSKIEIIKTNNILFDKKIDIIFENLTEEETKYSSRLISNLEEDFKVNAKRIIFSKKLSCSGCYGEAHIRSKTVYVNWDAFPYKYVNGSLTNKLSEIVKINLCHELLHFDISVPDDCMMNYNCQEHRKIKKIAETGVCYVFSSYPSYQLSYGS